MAQVTAIRGVAEVLKNLRAKQRMMGEQCSRGLRRAGLFLQRESQLRVPVDFGVLKSSAYTRANGKGWSTKVNVGYTASYAVYVHENVEMKWKGLPRKGKTVAGKKRKGRYWDPQGRGQAKFLEEPSRTLAPRIRQIIKDEIKIV